MKITQWLFKTTSTGSTYLQVLIIGTVLCGILGYVVWQLFLAERNMKERMQKMFDEVQKDKWGDD